MKTLLFFSGQSSLSHIFKQIFLLRSSEVEVVNYLDFLPSYYHKLLDKSGKLPSSIALSIRNYYLRQIQLKYVDIINEKKPDIIFIYNDQMLCAETLDSIDKGIKIGVFLADSPLFLQNRTHIMGLIRRADVVYAPDTYWIDQCRMVGVKRVEYLIPGYDVTTNFKLSPTLDQLNSYKSDVFFMGSPYPDSWGYKRALFLSKFCDFDFRMVGPKSWQRWFHDFPELEKRWICKEGYLPDDELNVMMNCSKIIPVDANPGIINGFHVRVLDSIAAGVLPLVEYRSDLEAIFRGTDLPLIKNYNDIKDIVSYLLSHDSERNKLIDLLRSTILTEYSINDASERIFSSLLS